MYHNSKFPGKYQISESVCHDKEDVLRDDITLIWRVDCGPHQLCGWHYGKYNRSNAEYYIEKYLGERAEAMKKCVLIDGINEVLGNYMDNYGIESEDISPEQNMKFDALVSQMVNLLKEIAEQNKTQKSVLDLPICYVDLIEDCLETIQKHDLLELVYGSYADDEDMQCKKDDLNTVLENFCRPLTARDKDVTINLID